MSESPNRERAIVPLAGGADIDGHVADFFPADGAVEVGEVAAGGAEVGGVKIERTEWPGGKCVGGFEAETFAADDFVAAAGVRHENGEVGVGPGVHVGEEDERGMIGEFLGRGPAIGEGIGCDPGGSAVPAEIVVADDNAAFGNAITFGIAEWLAESRTNENAMVLRGVFEKVGADGAGENRDVFIDENRSEGGAGIADLEFADIRIAGRQGVGRVVGIKMQGEGKLADVVHAICATGTLLGADEGREKEAREDADDGDDNERFDEGKAGGGAALEELLVLCWAEPLL